MKLQEYILNAFSSIFDLNQVLLKENKKLHEDYKEAYDKLKAENKRLNDGFGLSTREDFDEIEELRAELMESRKKCRMMVNKADELQADKGALYDHNTHLQAEIKEKEKQYHMLASSKSSHYPKEYRQEAEEYFSHNPNGEKLFFFMVGDSEVDEDGDIRKTLNVGVDAIAECDNFNGDISVEVFK